MANFQHNIKTNGEYLFPTSGKYCDRDIALTVDVPPVAYQKDMNIPNTVASEGEHGWSANCGCDAIEVVNDRNYLSIRTSSYRIVAYGPLIPAKPNVPYELRFSYRGNTHLNLNIEARSATDDFLEERSYTVVSMNGEWMYHTKDNKGNLLSLTPTDERTAYLKISFYVNRDDFATQDIHPWVDVCSMSIRSQPYTIKDVYSIPTQVATDFQDGWVRGGTCSVTEVKMGEHFLFLNGAKGWGAKIFMPVEPDVEYTFTFTHKSSTFFKFAMQSYDGVDGKCLEEKDVRQVRSRYKDWITSTFSFTPTDPETKYLFITLYRDDMCGWTMMKDMKLIARKGMPELATVAYTGTMGRSATLYYTDVNQQPASVTFTNRVWESVTVLKNSLLLLDGGLYPRYYQHGASGITVPCADQSWVFLVSDDGYLYTQDDEVS